MAALAGRVPLAGVGMRRLFLYSPALEVMQGLESVGVGGGRLAFREVGWQETLTLKIQLSFCSLVGGGVLPMKIIGGFFTWTPDGIPTLSNITIHIPRGKSRSPRHHGLEYPP